jgi:hypothetical protein
LSRVIIHQAKESDGSEDYQEFKVRGAEMRSAAQTIYKPNAHDHLIERPASE